MARTVSGTVSLQRIGRVCRTASEGRALRLALLDEIRQVVPFDAYAWLLTDPETSVGTSPVADVPCLPELPRLIRLKYLTEVNRWTRLQSPVALLVRATGGDLSQSRLWRELLCRHGVVDVASLVFADAFGRWGFLDLWRRRSLGPFTTADEGYLTAISAPVTAALRRGQAEAFTAADGADPLRGGPVVMLLSGDLDVLAQTAETQERLRILVPPEEGRAPIPAGAYNVAAQLLAVEAGVDENPPSVRVHLAGDRWLTLRAARIGAADVPPGGHIAVTLEDSYPAERAELFGRALGMTTRERELLGHLITGGDTRDIAAAMFLSQHTVQDHLKSMFGKASVHSRRALLTRALGT